MTVAGRRILVTREQHDAERWAERLASLGAAPVIFPCLVTELCDDAATATALSRALLDAHWLVLTSRRGAAAVAQLLGGPLAATVRIAAVGPATAQACADFLGRADFVSSGGTAAALGSLLGDRMATSGATRIVIATAVDGRDDAAEALIARGLTVTRIDVYRTVPSPAVERRYDFATAGIDDVLLASPSAVTGLLNTALVPRDARVITIGPTTTAAATAAGLHVTAEALTPTFNSLLEALR